jgi:DNA polymerase-3 subunit epsilon
MVDNMKDYIVLDLETPNRFSNGASSMGIVIVENGCVVDKMYSLINPETHFDKFNIEFTGIGPEDVVDAPTFPEYYEQIKDLLQDNIIVGQNITFDLSVISKTLTRYEMPIPSFKYYCTLNSSKRNLNLPSNKLSYIVANVLNTTYNAHNAMDDAQMTYKLYKYLLDYENPDEYIQTYCYRPNCKRDFNRKLDYNFNYLYGLIQKVRTDDKLTDNYYNLLSSWYEDNKCYNNHPLLENVLLKVSYILDECDCLKNREEIVDSFRQIKRSPEYSASLLKLQVFKGLVDSVTCEDNLKQEDIILLEDWIDENNVNDKSFKKFKKELGDEDLDKKDYLVGYSEYLDEYIS